MQYTLITSRGRVYTFFLRVVAEQWQQAYGGVVFSQQELDQLSAVDLNSRLCYNNNIN